MNTFKKNLIASGIILASATSSLVHAGSLGLEARSLGMGNVSVATADIATAALANPAMLSYQDSTEDFSFLLSFGALIDDDEEFFDSVNAFQNATTQLAADQAAVGGLSGDQQIIDNANAQITSVNAMNTAATSLDGQVLSPSVEATMVIGFAFEEYSLAISARTDVVVAAGLTSVNFGNQISPISVIGDVVGAASDISTAQTAVENPANNILIINNVLLTEVGISGAKSFEMFDRKISVGLTPKIISAESISSATPIASFDTGIDLIDVDNVDSLGETATFDLGIVTEISESTQVGLVIKNVIEDTLTNGGSSINIARQMKVGIAYRDDLFTLGIDLDLLETDPVIGNSNLQSNASQIFAIGAEFDAWDFAQIRVGLQKNLAGNIAGEDDQVLTAGIGLWLGFNLDVAVIASESVAGGIVQAGFKF